MALLVLPEETRDKYFSKALNRALSRKEITTAMAAVGVARSDLYRVAQKRVRDVWLAVSEEEESLVEVLAEREPFRPALRDKATAIVISAPAKALDERVKRVESVLLSALVEKGILPLLREELNRRGGSSDDLVLRLVDAPGLAEMVEPTAEIRTAAFEEIERLMKQMPGGSIGIAGPRGVGKSTLIQAFCNETEIDGKPVVAIELAAPVDYEPREFVLHLFERLCAEVRGPMSEASRLMAIRDRRFLPGALFVALTAAAALLTAAALGWHPHPSLWWIAVAFLTADGIIAVTWLARKVLSYLDYEVQNLFTKTRVSTSLRLRARDLLREIKFQQSFTQGWSGSLKLPAGFEVGGERSRMLAERQMSFPDVVGRLREFIREIVYDHSPALHLVVIGIDEMDKIASTEAAQRFLNDIKGIFGLRGCFYLVSISEDAMSNFERRGLPFRDAFDSSFDEVVPATFFRLADLEGRVVGLGHPFVFLAHCISGGLPRDVIRVARTIASYGARPEAERHIQIVCQSLVGEELRGKCDALTLAARTLTREPELSDFVRWARGLQTIRAESTTLLAFCREYPGSLRNGLDGDSASAPERSKLIALATELASFVYFAATVIEFFKPPLGRAKLEQGRHATDERQRLDNLAETRQLFAINAAVAWERVSSFRQAWGYEVLEFPPRSPRLSNASAIGADATLVG